MLFAASPDAASMVNWPSYRFDSDHGTRELLAIARHPDIDQNAARERMARWRSHLYPISTINLLSAVASPPCWWWRSWAWPLNTMAIKVIF